jgi:putative two-component system response regulator
MKELLIADKADVLVVDDQAENLHLLVSLLSPHYNVHPFIDGQAMLRYINDGKPTDLILLDVVMPTIDGYELCRMLRAMPDLLDVPIVFLTGLDSMEDEARGLSLGAVDYISKPFSPPIVLARVANHVTLGRALRLIVNQNDLLEHRVAERTAQLAQRNIELQAAIKQVATTQDVTIMAFSALAEARDNETGRHLRRTQNFIRELALELRKNPLYTTVLDDETIELIFKSAPLHDIGKVAIPDSILLKTGRLDPDEFEIMKTHADHGRRAIAAAEANLNESNSFLQLAREIAYGHHEKWDGSGYPNQIAGTAIPLPARLMAVADVYDALTSRRVYKASMPHEKAASIIAEGRGTHFEPGIVDAFFSIESVFSEIAKRYGEGESA